jgi:hypothetical protein
VALVRSHFKRASRWGGFSSWMGWDTTFFTCSNCNTLVYTHRVYKRYNCRVHCDNCNTFVIVVDSKRRCILCGDRVECLAHPVIFGKRYKKLEE